MKKRNWRPIIVGVVFVAIIFISIITTLAIKGFNAEGLKYYLDRVLRENFLAVNALLIGSIVLIGYLILNRTITEAVLGTLKAIIGVFLLAIGASTLVGLGGQVFSAFRGFGQVTPLDPYLGWQSAQTFLDFAGGFTSWISFSLLLGLVINIILVALKRWTNVHSVMITGHVMFQQASIVAVTVFITLFYNGSFIVDAGDEAGIIIISGLILGAYWGVGSTATIKGSDVVTQNAGFAVGHQQMLGIALSYKIGKYFGKAENSSENRQLSEKLKIFEDNIFTQSLIITFLFLVLIIIIQTAQPGGMSFAGANNSVNGANFSAWKEGEVYWLVAIFLGSLKLVASIIAIQTGVRMFVTELQQSFQGISEKLVPGAVVAVDVAATYGFSPNSVTYGFFSGTFGQFLALGIVIALSRINGLPIVIAIPLFITLFFNSGSFGVFANASGGFKATLIVPFLIGFFEIIIISFALGLFNHNTEGIVATKTLDNGTIQSATAFGTGYIGMGDWNLFWGFVMLIGSNAKTAGWIAVILYVGGLLFTSQLLDSGRQTKPTLLQKIFKINPVPYVIKKEDN